MREKRERKIMLARRWMTMIIAHFLTGRHIFADAADGSFAKEGRDFRTPFDECACQRTVAAGKTSVARRQCRAASIARLLWILFPYLALRIQSGLHARLICAIFKQMHDARNQLVLISRHEYWTRRYFFESNHLRD